MPRLVLFGDDGREQFSCDVTQRNAELVASFVRNHLAGPLQALVVVKRAWAAMFPEEPQPRALPAAPPRKKRAPRAIYVPPSRKVRP